jgi:hypothetical protein
MSKYIFNLPPSHYGNARDMMFDEFDTTWAHIQKYKDQRTFAVLPIENAEDDGEVVYNFNNEFYRCDDFTDKHEPGKHVLFGGCSQTEGVGSPLETVWAKMIFNKLNSNGLVDGYFNLARSGYGWQKIISSFLAYVKKYGYPDYFFVLLPNVGRFFEWDEERSDWFYVQRYPEKGNRKDLKKREVKPSVFDQTPMTMDEHRRSIIDFYLGWRMLIEICRTNNVKLLWSTWDYSEYGNYNFFDSSNTIVELSSHAFQNYFIDKRPDGKEQKHDIQRRDGHHGILYHEYWYESFMNEIEKRGWFK